jgi:hypothetical protein
MPKMPAYAVVLTVLAAAVMIVGVVRTFGSEPKITVPPMSVPLDNDKLLKAIEETEDWDGESVGAAGEAGPWQMLPSTWREYSSEPFPYSGVKWRGHEAQRVVHEHASWIRDQMEKRRLPQTAYTFALFWKAGDGRVLRNAARRVDKEYAERAANIYATLTK